MSHHEETPTMPLFLPQLISSRERWLVSQRAEKFTTAQRSIRTGVKSFWKRRGKRASTTAKSDNPTFKISKPKAKENHLLLPMPTYGCVHLYNYQGNTSKPCDWSSIFHYEGCNLHYYQPSTINYKKKNIIWAWW